MIFNKNDNGPTELQQLVGTYFRSNDFSVIAPEIESAARTVRQLIGSALYERAEKHYMETDEEPDETAVDDRLVKAVQLPIAQLAMVRFYQQNIVSHEDGGRKVKIHDGSEKMPWQWQYDRDDQALLDKYYWALDDLYTFLEESAIEEWEQSPLRQKLATCFVKDLDAFQSVFPIEDSPRMFYILVPFMLEAQDRIIRPIVGNEAFERMETGAITEELSEQFAAAKRCIPLYAVITAVKRMSIKVLPTMIVRRFTASYSEMTRPQLLYVMRQLYALQQNKITVGEFQLRALYRLAGIKRTARSIVWAHRRPEAMRRIIEKATLLADRLLGFLFTNAGSCTSPAFDAVANPLPTLRIGPIRLVGPADGLLDLSLEELIAADAELTLYTETHDRQHIDELIAILYRRLGPMQPSGRRAEPFRPERAARMARFIRFVPGWKKQLVLLWYTACIDHLQHGIFTICGREVSFAPLFSSGESSGKSLGWLGIQFDLAEKRTFGGMEATGKTNIIDILTLLLNYKYASDHAKKTDPAD